MLTQIRKSVINSFSRQVLIIRLKACGYLMLCLKFNAKSMQELSAKIKFIHFNNYKYLFCFSKLVGIAVKKNTLKWETGCPTQGDETSGGNSLCRLDWAAKQKKSTKAFN
jgi:hypothetical protein